MAASIGVNSSETFKNCVALELLSLFKYFISHALGSWASVPTVEFDSKVFIWTSWVVTCGKNNSTKTKVWPVVLIESSDYSRYSWSRQKAVLSNINLSDSVTYSNFNNYLSGNVIVVSSIS